MKKQLNTLLEKEMTRQEFLAAVGMGLASLFGFSSVLRMLNGSSGKSVSGGYGSSGYGEK